MKYKDIKKQARGESCPQEKQDQININKLADEDLEKLVVDKYKDLATFYEDVNDPNNVIPERDEIRQSLHNLLLAEEKVKYTEMENQYKQIIEEYKRIVQLLLQSLTILSNIKE